MYIKTYHHSECLEQPCEVANTVRTILQYKAPLSCNHLCPLSHLDCDLVSWKTCFNSVFCLPAMWRRWRYNHLPGTTRTLHSMPTILWWALSTIVSLIVQSIHFMKALSPPALQCRLALLPLTRMPLSQLDCNSGKVARPSSPWCALNEWYFGFHTVGAQ